jgi:hypothetical protein
VIGPDRSAAVPVAPAAPMHAGEPLQAHQSFHSAAPDR